MLPSEETWLPPHRYAEHRVKMQHGGVAIYSESMWQEMVKNDTTADGIQWLQ